MMSVRNKILDGRNKHSRVHTKDTNTYSHCALFQPVVIMLSSLQLFLTQFVPLSCSPTLINTHSSLLNSTASHCVCDYSLLISVPGWRYGPIIFNLWCACPQSSPSTLGGDIAFHIPTTQPDDKRYLQGNYCNVWHHRKNIKYCVSIFLTHGAILLKHTVAQ